MNVRCPSCGAEQPESARFCNACGTTLSPPAAVPPAKPRNQTTGLVIVLGAIGIIAAVILARIVFPSLSTWQPPPTAAPLPDVGTDRGAWSICQTFVGRQLKAPSTASFGGFSDSFVSHPLPGQFTVNSYVDAQNSFGAQIRTAYACNVQYQGGGNWTLVSLTMDQP